MFKNSVQRVIIAAAEENYVSATFSLAKVIRTLTEIDVLVVNNGEDFLVERQNNSEPLMLVGANPTTFKDWYWGLIRSQENVLNPVIVLGNGSTENFTRKERLFGKPKYLEQHRYFPAPWEIIKILTALAEVKALESDTFREMLVASYAFGADLQKLLNHDLLKTDAGLFSCALAEGVKIAQRRNDRWLQDQFGQCQKHFVAKEWAEIKVIVNKIKDEMPGN